jgi:biopolymer transport protein ExbD
MPIKAPSSRIGSSVANMKTMGKSSLGGKKGVIVHLNVVPMIDMFTILVIFLLMMFSYPS